MSECPFCRRIDDRDYEQDYAGEAVVRFEPLNPVTPGHMLFVPGWHAEHPDPEVVRVAAAYAAQYARGGPDFNIIVNAGPAATQTIPHIHVHYVPRRDGDGLALPWTGQSKEATND